MISLKKKSLKRSLEGLKIKALFSNALMNSNICAHHYCYHRSKEVKIGNFLGINTINCLGIRYGMCLPTDIPSNRDTAI